MATGGVTCRGGSHSIQQDSAGPQLPLLLPRWPVRGPWGQAASSPPLATPGNVPEASRQVPGGPGVPAARWLKERTLSLRH